MLNNLDPRENLDLLNYFKMQLQPSQSKDWLKNIGNISKLPQGSMNMKPTNSFMSGLMKGTNTLGSGIGDLGKAAGLTSMGGWGGAGELAHGITDSFIKQPDRMGVEDEAVSMAAKASWKLASIAPNPYTLGAAAVISGFDIVNKVGGKKFNSDGTYSMNNTGYANFSAHDLLKEDGQGQKGTLLSRWFRPGKTKNQNNRIDFGKKSNLLASDASYQHNQNMLASQNTSGVLQDKNYMDLMGGYGTNILAARMGTKIPPVNLRNIANKAEWNKKKKLEEQKKKLEASKVLEKDTKYKDGGLLTKADKAEVIEEIVEEKTNVIPEGAFHSRKNNLPEEIAAHVTHKGIPVITEDGEKIIQHAEVERNEIIFHKEATDTIETLHEKYKKAETQKLKDEIMIECGKYVADQILVNTDDRTGIIETIE